MAKFQLTLPVWGATLSKSRQYRRDLHFNSRSPCGERPHGAGDILVSTIFQLTLPVWGATVRKINPIEKMDISTHAPRVGSDRENEI